MKKNNNGAPPGEKGGRGGDALAAGMGILALAFCMYFLNPTYVTRNSSERGLICIAQNIYYIQRPASHNRNGDGAAARHQPAAQPGMVFVPFSGWEYDAEDTLEILKHLNGAATRDSENWNDCFVQ